MKIPYAELHCLSAISASCAAPRTRRNWWRAPRLGYARAGHHRRMLARRRGARARRGEGSTALQLIIGTEIRLADGPAPGAARDRPRGYGNLSALITRGRRARGKGSYRLDARRPRRRRRAARLPRAVAARTTTRPHRDDAALAARSVFAGRAWIAARAAARRPRRSRRSSRPAQDSAQPRPAAGGRRRRAHARALAPRAAGHADRDPPRHARWPRPAMRCTPTASATCARGAARAPVSARTARRDAARSRSAALLARQLRYEYPEELVPAGRDAGRAICAQLTEDGLARRWPRGHRRPGARAQIEHELALIAELRYEPYFLTVHDIVALRARARHPVPGPRLGGQLGGVLLPRHHRGGSGAHEHAVRALHLAASATSRPTSTSTSSTSGARR